MSNTVRIERADDGTIKSIAVVEEQMESMWKALVAEGKVRDECKVDYLPHAGFFVFGPSGSLVHKETGLTLEAYTEDLLRSRTHWAPLAFADDEAAAFEHPTMASLAAYRKKYGEDRYEFERDRWGVSERPINAKGGLRPGTRPAGAEDKTTSKPDPRLSAAAVERDRNPFVRLRDPKTGAINSQVQDQIAGMIRAMGTKKVAEIAAAVGMTITGQPVRR